MKVLSAVALVVSLWVGRPAAADIEYGPFTFPDQAFADVAQLLEGENFWVWPDSCPHNVDVLTGFSPDCGAINIGYQNAKQDIHLGNWYQLDFDDLTAQNGPGPDIIFFEARFTDDAYEIAVRVEGQPFTGFLPYEVADFVWLGLPGPSDPTAQSAMYAMGIDLSTFGVAPNAVVDAIQFKALPADPETPPEGDPVMAAVRPVWTGEPNDICALALPIELGDTAFSTVNAYTMGPPHPECLAAGDDQVNSDVWFKWTAPCSGNLTASTCGGADFNTKIAVYETCGCSPLELGLQLRDCNDDAVGCGDLSEVRTFVFKDGCYLIRVGGFEGAQGTGTLTLSFKSFFDDCQSAEILDGVEGLLNVCTIDSNTDGPPHAACGGQIDADRWYDYIAQCQGELTVSTCSLVDFDSKIAIYDGCGCPVSDANLLACSDDEQACGGGSVVSVPIVIGNCYKIRLGGANGADGTGKISFSCAVAGACPWDVDLDGMVGVTDFLGLLAAWGPQPAGHAADFDGDGVVGVLDFLVLLAHWGPCPSPA